VTTIVFSPHQDDETLACGGTIAKKTRNGEEVYIIFMTDGRNSHKIALGIEKNPTPKEIKNIRKKESKEAAKILGVRENNMIFLDFEDGALCDNILKAKEHVKKYLILLNPTEVFLPHECDIHKDHYSTNIIVLSAVKELRLNLDVYGYVIWSNNDEKSQNVLKSPNLVKVDISDLVDLKSRALATYKSQVSLLFPSQTRPILDQSFLSDFKIPIECFIKYDRCRLSGKGE